MSFPIDPNIPDASHDPADDQMPMQTNFSNINMYLQVDHTDPAATNAGQHEQVTFAANNVPSLPTPTSGGNNIGILFTNTVAGAGAIDQLFYYAGSAAQSSAQYTAGTNGSTFLLGGIILKWGSSALVNVSQNFTSLGITAFPNHAYAMVITSKDAALSSPLKVTALNANAFTVTRSNPGNTPYYFFVIGN